MKQDNLINGKELSDLLLAEVKEEISSFKNKIPHIVIIQVGDNLASNKYIKHKLKTCERVGIKATHLQFKTSISQTEIENEIIKLNQDKNIHAMIVQLPLPDHLNEQKINEIIAVHKDADGFSPTTLGKVVLNNSNIFPATPFGIVKMLEWKNISLIGANVVIIGRSNIVGKPLANMLINKSATVTVCNTKTKDLSSVAKKADILISAAGSPKLITKDFVNKDQTVIDVGANFVDGKYCGDVDFENVQPNVKWITPVPGGVGPMTIACLILNTLTLFKEQN